MKIAYSTGAFHTASRSLASLVMGASLALLAPQAPAHAQDESTDRVNKIIQGLTERPQTRGARTRGLRTRSLNTPSESGVRTRSGVATRGAKATANIVCEDALSRVSVQTRAAKKDIEILDECIADRPKMDFRVGFELNSYDLTSQAQRVLNDLGRALEDPSFENVEFIVAGHTDQRGSRTYNQTLSKQRAQSVRDYLQENFRVRGKQLVTVGYGFDRLLNAANPYADENRRVEIIRR